MQHSRAITRRSASNLAMAFLLLPRGKREAMSALYAFCRKVDDVADEEAHPLDQRRAMLQEWREDIRRACEGGAPRFPSNVEFQPFIRRHHLPFSLFDELVTGCEMDLDATRYETMEDLEVYCHRVASVVGLLSIEIFGYRNPSTRNYAVALGKALQFTNILRDVGNDARRGRIYLPMAELRRFGVKPEEILEGRHTADFSSLARDFARRARAHYRTARETLAPEDRTSMTAAELMGAVYWRLLLRLERSPACALDPEPMRLGRACKLALILRSWLKSVCSTAGSDYGAP